MDAPETPRDPFSHGFCTDWRSVGLGQDGPRNIECLAPIPPQMNGCRWHDEVGCLAVTGSVDHRDCDARKRSGQKWANNGDVRRTIVGAAVLLLCCWCCCCSICTPTLPMPHPLDVPALLHLLRRPQRHAPTFCPESGRRDRHGRTILTTTAIKSRAANGDLAGLALGTGTAGHWPSHRQALAMSSDCDGQDQRRTNERACAGLARPFSLAERRPLQGKT